MQLNHKKLTDLLYYYERSNYLQGNLLIAQGNRVLYQKSYGQANIQLQVPNQPATRFKIASLTKAFTSMLAFMLQEQGHLDLDKPVNHYLKDCVINDEITLYHCLTCSSGLADFAAAEDYWPLTMRTPHTLPELIASIKEKPLLFAPGTAYSYSSTGYLIMTLIIEQVTGQTFAACLSELILEPLHMTDSGCLDDVQLTASLADSYGFWEEAIQTAKTDMSFPTGAAGIYATTADMLKWARAVQDQRLLSAAATQKYLQPFQDSYACGWDICQIRGYDCWQHCGDLDGFATSIKILPELDLTIILLANIEIIPVPVITRQLAEALLGKSWQWPKGTPTVLSRIDTATFLGRYSFMDENDQKQFLELSQSAGKLFLTTVKRYDIAYKFPLNVLQDNQQTVLKTECINEWLSAAGATLSYHTFDEKTYQLQRES